MAIAQSSATPTPLVQHACALVLCVLRSWGFDFDGGLGNLEQIDRLGRHWSPWNRDRGLLSFADLRGHCLFLSKQAVKPYQRGLI